MSARSRNAKIRRVAVVGAILSAVLQIEGCYYMQAVRGHLEVMRSRQPIPDVIAAADSPGELGKRLAIVQDARDFAVTELLLPDNDSYRTYADLGRDYVVWNVFAAPEFSLEPKTWCFPVAGCVAYRGYFAEHAARDKARDLEEDGYDVAVGGVAAYSTLGRFADPVLNTMMRWSDLQLVSTIFHELAHQRLYIKGDTAFNESFASVVADAGIDRWLAQNHQSGNADADRANRELRRTMMALVEESRNELTALYAATLDQEEKRAAKRELLDKLSAAAADLVAQRGGGARNWLAPPLNNARLASLGLYEGRRAAFETLLRGCDQQLACFYAAAEELAELDQAERTRRLDRLMQ